MIDEIIPTKPVTCAEEIFFRCSGLGYIMTDARSKSNPLSETCITHLIDVFVSAKYGRKEEARGKMLEKGNEREEDSITLVSAVTKQFFKKNDIRLRNEFIQGEPDLFTGESIRKADKTRDTKTSWSAHTFFRAKNKPLDKNYYWQGQGYMALTGAKQHSVDFCLVNGTAGAIIAEKRKASFRYGIDAENDPGYIEECKQIEVNHIFDFSAFYEENPGFDFHNSFEDLQRHSIPMVERLYTVTFERNEDEIKALYERVATCRDWMNKILFKLQPSTL